jgi:hypothetical protein
MRRLSIPLPNGLLYVRDSESLDDPFVDGKGSCWRTDGVVAIACQGDVDGPTTIVVNGDAGSYVGLSMLTAFDLAAPSKRLSFETVPDDLFHEMTLDATVAHVEPWTKGCQCRFPDVLEQVSGHLRREEMNGVTEFSIFLPNGLLFVRDLESIDDPVIDGRASFWRTGTVLAIACRYDGDGATRIVIDQVAPDGKDLSFLAAVELLVPSGRVLFEMVPHDPFHEVTWERDRIRVEVWTEGIQETSIVWLKVE